jgi:RNA polymerase sigma factor (sigma-70 family)
MRKNRRQIVTWVGSNILPHEADLRARLRRMAVPEDEIGDIIQDAYVKISNLESVSHIRSGRGYLFATARTILLDRIRRSRIVRIDSMTEMEELTLADEEPGPERRVSSRLELERVRKLIAALPSRCREIFEMRRIQGVPQREIAQRLGIPEHTVEAQAVRGLKLILKALGGEEQEQVRTTVSRRERDGEQQRNG